MSYFAEETNTQEVEKEVVTSSGAGSFMPSGLYAGMIKTAGIYDTEGELSKGLVLNIQLDNGNSVFQYFNFINKQGKSTRTLPDGKIVKGYGLEQVEMFGKLLDLGTPNSHTTECELWYVAKKARLFEQVLGKKVKVGVRHVFMEGEEFPDKNEIELFVDINTNKTCFELYYSEEDSRSGMTVAKWEAKIAKSPTLVRKNKSKPKAQASISTSDAAKKNGWYI